MTDNMVNDDLCEKCQSIFGGHWEMRGSNATAAHDDSQLGSCSDVEEIDEDAEPDFYDRPDWIHATSSQSSAALAQSPKHHDITWLEEISANSCKLCSLIWDQLRDQLQDHEQISTTDQKKAIGVVTIRPSFVDTSNELTQDLPRTLDLEITYCLDGREDLEKAYLHLVVNLELGNADEWPHSRPKSTNVHAHMSPDTIAAIRSWVSKCRGKHTECRADSNVALSRRLKDALPTRLLDVASELAPHFIRLVETAHFASSDRAVDYVTLSHRWGDSLPTQLRGGNYDNCMQSMCVQELPQTFQDTIEFTRALGVRYLWIDAICIIQDSRSDWLHESALMASVYSCAYLNIAATHARDGHSGLFQQRSKTTLSPCLVQASWTGHTAGDYVCWDKTIWQRHIEQSSLSSRAWIFQERLLAPRTIHCARLQTWWECRGLIANECFPDAAPYDGQDWHYAIVESLAEMSKLAKTDIIKGNQHWMRLVERYTHTNITKDSDRLLALSGIASAVSQNMEWLKEDYAAGLWKGDFVSNLLWMTDGKATRNQNSYVAPTWSWASVNGPIRHWQSDSLDLVRSGLRADIKEIVVETDGDALGVVKRGHIVLDAYIYQVSFLDPHDGTYPYFGRLQFGQDQVELSQAAGHFDESMDDDDYYNGDEMKQLDVVWCMISSSKTSGPEDVYVCHGLILTSSQQGCAGIYRRIGQLRLFLTDDTKDLTQQLSSHQHGLDSVSPCSDGRSTIKII